ncbi:MAG: transketolase family protein [Lachnospiraceae bacterium]|nr:transketolase family protein [Lachnospiraceae bacterium]
MKKIATRVSYGETLVELGASHPEIIVLDADLAAATKTDLFKKAYPERHFECGIAEANMIGVAAGLSTMGLVPFASSFAMFSAGRAYEQIRNSVGYPHMNVKIAGTHAGISVGEDGASHQCCEDIALMRTIPGMTVLCPADDIEAREAVRQAYAWKGPVYLRFSRLALPVFHEGPSGFRIGKGEVLHEGRDIAFIATGQMSYEALQAALQLEQEGIHARVINMCSIKPLDEELVLAAASDCGRIITCEEHSIIGGLGEAVCGVISEKCPVPVYRIGVNDVFGHSGPGADLLKEFGLSAEHVAETARQLLHDTAKKEEVR